MMASWFFGTPKSNLPAVTPLQAQRSKQIDSLKNINPNVVELKRDEEYRIGFTCGTNHVTFTIYLPPDFPQVKPVITVAPAMRHKLVDDSMQIARYLPLVNFNVHTDLGKMIQSLIQEFGKSPMLIQQDNSQQRGAPAVPPYQQFMPHPPSVPPSQQLPPFQQPHPVRHPMQQTQPHQPSPPQHASHMQYAGGIQPAQAPQFVSQVPTPPASSISQSHLGTSSSSMTSSSSSNALDVEPNMPVPGMLDGRPYPMPAIPSSFDDVLGSLSAQELENLLEDEEMLDATFRRIPQLARMIQDRAELYQSCDEIAKLNLSYQPELQRLRRELEETVCVRNDLKNGFDMKSLHQQRLNEQCSLPHVLDNIRVMAADAEHQSDDLAEKFLEDKVPLDEFLKQFSEQRRLLHLRRVKEEKIQSLMGSSQAQY